MSDAQTDLKKVRDGGYCVGCGACALPGGPGGKMRLTPYGEYEPDLAAAASPSQLEKACPFLAPELDEDHLAETFLDGRQQSSRELGYYNSISAAHVEEAEWRANGSSGGMVSWLAAELLRTGQIDGIIHARPVSPAPPGGPFYAYGISRTVEDVAAAAHSHYHVVEMSGVLEEVLKTPGRYLFIGVPCFVKAIRRLQTLDPRLNERIAFTIGLVCGHLKSVNWSLSLGWGAGIPPEELAAIRFREKGEDIPAKSYHFAVRARGSDDFLVRDAASIAGGRFNTGAMMLRACDFCDDVVGETADLTVGDAWLPEYQFDWRGKNMIVIRSTYLEALIHAAFDAGRLSLTPMSARQAADAQSGGFRHRREGLAYRLAGKQARGEWHPVKRSFNVRPPSPLRRLIYTLRQGVSLISREAFVRARSAGDFGIYAGSVRRAMQRLRFVELVSAAPRILSVRIRHILSKGRRS
ncbi:Coenzyme F420 hydrogenase/dehydrogenase, beta subunit C-terminal domain [Hyphomonas sp. NPDC076900]|uniref:Coenzyme F420 hydrogenase/dehydrogenase, beta subunit C-terminal domain n=1 Tax=unclassified Hyphomonas TaxID=2630699 RepID=UPI003D045255